MKRLTGTATQNSNRAENGNTTQPGFSLTGNAKYTTQAIIGCGNADRFAQW